jgi:hypothetical protein
MNDFRVPAARSFSEGQSDVWLSKCNGKRKTSRFANGIGDLWYKDQPPHMKGIACNH